MPSEVFRLDVSIADVDRRLLKATTKTIPWAVRRGITKALEQLLRDIVLEEPMAPVYMGAPRADVIPGALIGAITIFINGVFHSLSKYGVPSPYVTKSSPERPRVGREEGVLLMNAPYTAEQHEYWERKTKPGAGRFFVLRKLIQYRDRYVRIFIDEIKAAQP